VNLIKYIIIGVLILLIALCLLYFALVFKLKGVNKRIFKYEEEEIIKDKNVLIIYQPSRRKTTTKIKELVKEEILSKGYGIKVHTLTRIDEDYSKYKSVVFITPVYFGEVNVEIINKIRNNKMPNLIIIYNGLNKESENEDKLIKGNSASKYKKIKLYTNDIERVKEFIKKEVL